MLYHSDLSYFSFKYEPFCGWPPSPVSSQNSPPKYSAKIPPPPFINTSFCCHARNTDIFAATFYIRPNCWNTKKLPPQYSRSVKWKDAWIWVIFAKECYICSPKASHPVQRYPRFSPSPVPGCELDELWEAVYLKNSWKVWKRFWVRMKSLGRGDEGWRANGKIFV